MKTIKNMKRNLVRKCLDTIILYLINPKLEYWFYSAIFAENEEKNKAINKWTKWDKALKRARHYRMLNVVYVEA